MTADEVNKLPVGTPAYYVSLEASPLSPSEPLRAAVIECHVHRSKFGGGGNLIGRPSPLSTRGWHAVPERRCFATRGDAVAFIKTNLAALRAAIDRALAEDPETGFKCPREAAKQSEADL